MTPSLVVAILIGLALLDIFVSDYLPGAAISVFELPYTVFGYLPTAIIGAVILDPLGISELAENIPFGPEILLLTTLAGFYYLLTVALINLVSLSRHRSNT